MNNSSTVFVTNVDDYLSPSLACVNPLYNNSIFTGTSNPQPAETIGSASSAPFVVPRQRQLRPKVRPGEGARAHVRPKTAPTKDPIKASMSDCLACSGCVTTAETVLLEQQHSLTALKAAIKNCSDQVRVATISPAVWADMLRHLKIPSSEARLWQQKLATSLLEVLQVSYVLDGSIPLEWSLLESAEEFCLAYQKKNCLQPAANACLEEDTITQMLEQKKTPSVAVHSNETKYFLPDGITQMVSTAESLTTPSLPLLTSSCPALVCLAEKSTHSAVPHLSKTKSPMSLAGAWWRCQQSPKLLFFHLAFMPCHDKKLEASRKDFLRDTRQDVDLVLTTQEWFQMLTEYCQERGLWTGSLSKDEIRIQVKGYLESLPAAPIQSQLLTQSAPCTFGKVTLLSAQNVGREENAVVLDEYTPPNDKNGDTDLEKIRVDNGSTKSITNLSTDTQNGAFFARGSGGLAEFVFRHAAWRLFNTHITHIPWKPVERAPFVANRVVSARLQERAAAKNRDYYEVTLYRRTELSSKVTFSCCPLGGGVPVLRFGVAYGLQTVQRILEPFQLAAKNGCNSADDYPFDYVEAMACPSGCLNGGGQLRIADRETPTQTRQRLAMTRDLFVSSTVLPVSRATAEAAVPTTERRTRFHVVQSLQHFMGAAAGLAVRDTQW